MSKLEEELRTYIQKGNTPFHMPGHKRRNVTGADLPYEIDMTEIGSTDDLHDAQGILKEAMDRTAKLYGTARTWYLVNGSTCGNLAGIFALTHQNAEVIAVRSCHISVCHAIQLRGLHVHWVMAEIDGQFGIATGIDPEKIEEMLVRYPSSECVILTSPTYEGVVSDIAKIARICHEHNCALFVDEAHGAHFSLEHQWGIEQAKAFPKSACQCGADLVVQSAHKTLPSLTQTAWMHRNTDRVSDKRVERMLRIFETSSPSYPLMVSLDACSETLQKSGKEMFAKWHRNLDWFYQQADQLRKIEILHWKSSFFAFDQSKLVLRHPSISGLALSNLLRETFGIECEMGQGNHVLCMTAVSDERESYERLLQALRAIDEMTFSEMQICESVSIPQMGETVCTIQEAVEADGEVCGYADSINRICQEYVYLYPPGIPFLIPGERIGAEACALFSAWKADGTAIRFSNSENDNEITVVKEEEK